jgi:RNA polymerase sigma factor (sigma-70 family)
MNEQLEQAIVAAQHGDLEAFRRVVVQFQRMAYAVAYAMLGDAHLAEDAAQEAFIEAFLNLAKLREPAAFPGWFRRIVLKRSDRLVRGKSLSIAPFEMADTHASPTPDLAAQFEAREIGQQLQQAINSLPDIDRQLVWLFYLAGYAHAEIGSVLDLSAAVVKKRLFRARQCLRSQLDQTMRAWRPEQPSDSAMFTLTVQFFIAVRLGDTAQVQRLLTATPALRNAHERWDAATALQHGLPLVSQFTALHRAAYNGDLALTRLLLDHQADTEERTSASHTPLHVAVSSNHAPIVEVLLRAEADPNSATQWGQTPLHFAVMRERPSIARQLLVAGAHPTSKAARLGTPKREFNTARLIANVSQQARKVAPDV